MPKVSIIIPSYNHANYIEAAIQSVLTQTYGDLQVIVVDDGSTDESSSILQRLTNEKVQVVFQQNRGAHAAINRGLSMAEGKYLAILNSDDVYVPQRLEKAISILDANPEVGLVSSYIEIIDSKGKSLGIKQGYKNCHPWSLERPDKSFRALDSLKLALVTENYLATTSNYIFPRATYEKVGEFRPLRYTHDWDFALRLARIAEIYMIEEPLLKYRVHPKNTIKEDKATMIFEICWTIAVNVPILLKERPFQDNNLERNLVDLLLNSLFTYHCENVLSVMLLHSLHTDEILALSLLQPENPDRLFYLEAIHRTLEMQEGQHVKLRNVNPLYSLGSFFRSILEK
ncbi:MAG: glycosyltransferase [Thermosphaera sp.]